LALAACPQQQHPLSETTQVSRHLKGKINLDFTETMSGSGISWAIYKSAPRCRQIIMPALVSSVFSCHSCCPINSINELKDIAAFVIDGVMLTVGANAMCHCYNQFNCELA